MERSEQLRVGTTVCPRCSEEADTYFASRNSETEVIHCGHCGYDSALSKVPLRITAFALAFLLGLSAQAQNVTVSQPGAGQISGTTTNDNAAAGNVGEFIAVFTAANSGTATFTAATPTVVTVASWTSGVTNSLSPQANCFPTTGASCIQPVYFTNSGGALPTGITSATTYYIDPASWSGNTFKIATTAANALAGTDLGVSDAGTGTQTAVNAVRLVSGGSGVAVSGLVLTAGDWNCGATTSNTPGSGTTTTILTAAINGTAGASGLGQISNGSLAQLQTSIPANGISTLTSGPRRIPLASTTLEFLNFSATFATSTLDVYGFFKCRRAR